jgi:hypothetical protein
MKIATVLLVTSAAALPQIAAAELPFTPQSLGTVQGTIDFCAKVRPDAAHRYQEFAKHLVNDVSREDIAKARATGEYHEAYEAITRTLSEAPKREGTESCAAFLEQDWRG